MGTHSSPGGEAGKAASKRNFKVWRGDETGGDLQDYQVEVNEGEDRKSVV